MIDHLKLLGVVVNLVIAAGVAFYVRQKAEATAALFLKPLFFHVLLLNAAVWILFLTGYSRLNMPSLWPSDGWAGQYDLTIILIYVIGGGMVFAVMRIVSGILEKSVPSRLVKGYQAGMLILVFGYGLKWLVPERGFWWKVHYDFYENAGLVFFLLEIGLLIRLWRKSAGEADAVKARLGKSFAILYLVRYPVIVGIIPIPHPLRTFVFLLFLNAVPVVWLRIFFRAYEEKLDRASFRGPGMDPAGLEEICREYDISKRERDILTLILAGKSNRDIGRELFISYHTVKNHVYNLFQKLGVGNRFELARIIETRIWNAGGRAIK